MPIYEFQCRECRVEFEVLTGLKHDNVRCPNCGRGKVEKKFSVFGMRSSGRFESSVKSSCSGCSSGSCVGCGH